MDVRPDCWLSEVIGRAAFRVDASVVGPVSVDELRAHVSAQTDAFYFSKVDCQRVDVVRQMGSAGFFVADVNVIFALDREPAFHRPPPSGLQIRDCSPDDVPEVLDVAGSAFRYARFHLDPVFSTDVANRIKRAWIQSYVDRVRGDKLFAARLEGHAVGFLAALSALQGDRRIAAIDLIAVAAGHQGKQIGAALVQAFVRHYRPDHDVLQVGTQAANVPSVRLYERLGFSLSSSQFVLHLHVRGGLPLL